MTVTRGLRVRRTNLRAITSLVPRVVFRKGLRPIERVYALLPKLPAPLTLAAAGFGHRMMQNRQLWGIKRRAEGRARRPSEVNAY